MSETVISGSLILNGDLACTGSVTINPGAVVTVVPDEDLKKQYNGIYSNGAGRVISSLTGDITVGGVIDGHGQGFRSNQGPGCNSLFTDSSGNFLGGYGATHAGLGAYAGGTAPAAKVPYGGMKSPVSLGSGSGYYIDSNWFVGEETSGGGAIKLQARSGIVHINGAVNMDGLPGVHAGGGSGGSIWVSAWNIDGTGTLTAQGGATIFPSGGGGGGGYIALTYDHADTFTGLLSVEGGTGAGEGKVYRKAIEPLLQEKFTGGIWNEKWWNHTTGLDLDNNVTFYNDGTSTPSAASKFKVSGRAITAACDYVPKGPDGSNFTAFFKFLVDQTNWVGVAKRKDRMWGMACYHGSFSKGAAAYGYNPDTFRIQKQDSTFLFQFYDSTSVSPITIYSDVLPDFANSLFSTQISLEQDASSSFYTEYRRVSTTDIASQSMYLMGIPPAGVAVNVLAGTSQYSGLDFTCIGDKIYWDASHVPGDGTTVFLRDIIAAGDVLRFIYSFPTGDMTTVAATFDNVRIYDGGITNAETLEPVIYVDSSQGSDSSSGKTVEPLRNLFVATAWAKRGGTVVLYDGTYNPTEVAHKDLTIRGAYGSRPYITSRYVQDTTGSDWEINALKFHECQGLVENVIIGDGTNGIFIEQSPYFEVRKCTLYNLTEGVKTFSCDPVVLQSLIHSIGTGLDFSSCVSATAYSNIIYDAGTAVRANDTTGLLVVGNTIDDCTNGVRFDAGSAGVVASNNITDASVGIHISTDSSVRSYNNNFFGTTTLYDGIPAGASGNIASDPLYFLSAARNYHLDPGSPDMSAGTSLFDDYQYDFDNVPRLRSDIGAFQYIDTSHAGDWYVAGPGNDYLYNGDSSHPFRTLDRAYSKADSTIHIDGGHYDSYYLSLKNQALELKEVTIFDAIYSQLITYITLDPEDILHGYTPLPGFVTKPGDQTNIALNVIGGPAQLYGTDYIVSYGTVYWKGYALTPLLSSGDILRITYGGSLQRKVLNTLVLHSHYSNLNIGRMVVVSPSGSDSTVMGGDGTNTGGNGSWARPYRTVQTALANSNPGDNIVMHAGEYPFFDGTGFFHGMDGRILVPLIDRTSVSDKGLNRVFVEDFFIPKDFRSYGTVFHDEVPWDFSVGGNSWIKSDSGYLSLSFDGSNQPWAMSTFDMTGKYEVSADLRNIIDPVTFMVSGRDDTVSFSFNNTAYTAAVVTGGRYYNCWGVVNVPDSSRDPLVIEHITLTAEDIRNKYTALGYMPDDRDCTAVAVNLIGGVPQEYGEDFIVENARVIWDGLALDGELEPGDIMRVVYKDRRISGPVRVSLTLDDEMFRVKVYDTEWHTVMRRNFVGDSSSWKVSFFMNNPDTAVDHSCVSGRGFASNFLAVADGIHNTGLVEPYNMRTERRSVIFYKS